MKRIFSVLEFVLLIAPLVFLGTIGFSQTATTYQPSMASVKQHNPAPEWFQDAKFGIYFHWGAYSAASHGSEWYAREMYQKGNANYAYHLATYGDPYTDWPYNKFIDGGYDKKGNWVQFAPRLKSAGGNFDPDEWAQLFVDAGAKFAGPSAEHHDGFSMWDSKCNEWNSVNKGPHLNLASLFATAMRKKGLKFIMCMHQEYNYTGYYEFVPPQSDLSLKKLYGQLDKATEDQLWFDKMKEIVDGFQPDIIWQDGGYLMAEKYRLNYLSYYYNKALEWNKEVVTSYKGSDDPGELYDYEQGGAASIRYPFWLTDQNIGPESWSYVEGMDYYPAKALINVLVDRVSKNGSLLLDISPKADGTIPDEQKEILLRIGSWLKQYGEAIYSTRAWVTFGEGPTQMQGFPVEGTATDIRFTRNKANNVLYAIALGWPGNNQMVITSLKTGNFDKSTITGISLAGGSSLAWVQDSTGLKINLPANEKSPDGVAVKISFSGTIPGCSGSIPKID